MKLKGLKSLCTLRQQLQLRDAGITAILELAAFTEQELRDEMIADPENHLDYARVVVLGMGISSLTDFKEADRTRTHAVCTDHSIPADTVALGMQLLGFAVQGGTVGGLFRLLDRLDRQVERKAQESAKGCANFRDALKEQARRTAGLGARKVHIIYEGFEGYVVRESEGCSWERAGPQGVTPPCQASICEEGLWKLRMSDDNVNSGGKFDEALSCRGANNKASRERQRRIRLNDSFMELAKVLDPGKTPKTDKATIVSDAIRVVTQLRTENGQLQQLNKFLEERVSTHEKQRSEMMMRQAMYQNLTGQQPFMGSQMMMGGGMVIGQPVQGMPIGQPGFAAPGTMQPSQQMQPVAMPQQQACSSTQKEAETKDESKPAEAGPSNSGFPQAPAGNAMGQLSALLASDHSIFDWALADSASGVPDDHSWLPTLDGGLPDLSHEDSLRRPPAA